MIETNTKFGSGKKIVVLITARGFFRIRCTRAGVQFANFRKSCTRTHYTREGCARAAYARILYKKDVLLKNLLLLDKIMV